MEVTDSKSVTSLLHEQTQAFSEFRSNDKIMGPLKNALSVLDGFSATANFGQDIGTSVCIYIRNIQVYQTVESVIDSYNGLVDLLESIEQFSIVSTSI